MRAEEAEAFFRRLHENHNVRIEHVEKPRRLGSARTGIKYRVEIGLSGDAAARQAFHDAGFYTTEIDPHKRIITLAAHFFDTETEADGLYAELDKIRKLHHGLHTPESVEALYKKEFGRRGVRLLGLSHEKRPPELDLHSVRVTEARAEGTRESLLRFETESEALQAVIRLSALLREQAKLLNRIKSGLRRIGFMLRGPRV